MSAQHTRTLLSAVVDLLYHFFRLVSQITGIALLEARLAGISLIYIIGLLLCGLILIFSIWLGIEILLVFWFNALGLSPAMALCSVLGINIILLIPVYICIMQLQKNIMFPYTCKQLQVTSSITAQEGVQQ